MATKTWYPIADSGTVNFTGSDGNQVNNFEMIDEVSTDDADYVNYLLGTPAAYFTDYYTHTADDVPAGATSISITISYRYGFNGNPDSPVDGEASAGINGANGLDAYHLGKSAAAAADSVTFNTNPDGGAAWTPTTINAVLFAISLMDRAQVTPFVSQLSAVVTYTPAAAGISGQIIMIGE